MLKKCMVALWCMMSSTVFGAAAAEEAAARVKVDSSHEAVMTRTRQINKLIKKHQDAEKEFANGRAMLNSHHTAAKNKIDRVIAKSGAETLAISPGEALTTIKNIVASWTLHPDMAQNGDHVAVLQAAAKKDNPSELTHVDQNALLEYYRHDSAFKEYRAQLQKIFDEKNKKQQAIEAQLNTLLDERLKQLEARTPWQKFTAFMHDTLASSKEKIRKLSDQMLRSSRTRLHKHSSTAAESNLANELNARHYSGHIKGQYLSDIQTELSKGQAASIDKIVASRTKLEKFNKLMQDQGKGVNGQEVEAERRQFADTTAFNKIGAQAADDRVAEEKKYQAQQALASTTTQQEAGAAGAVAEQEDEAS